MEEDSDRKSWKGFEPAIWWLQGTYSPGLSYHSTTQSGHRSIGKELSIQ